MGRKRTEKATAAKVGGLLLRRIAGEVVVLRLGDTVVRVQVAEISQDGEGSFQTLLQFAAPPAVVIDREERLEKVG